MFDKQKNVQQEEFSRPPIPNLNIILIEIMREARRPKMFPPDNRDVPAYWRAHQEPGNDHTEKVDWVSDTRAKSGGYWNTPYIDRLRNNLRIFLAMPHLHQVFVIDHIEKGIPWRGDGIEFYKMVIEEEAVMNEAIRDGKKDEYITAMFKKLKRIGGFRDLPYDKNERLS